MQAPTVIEHLSQHWSDRAGAAPRCIVLHHTAGTNSLGYLTQNSAQVSTHRLISKPGVIYKMVDDSRAANTVGFSTIGLYLAGTAKNPNRISLNIELENLGDGQDDYPDAQIGACGWQIAKWWKQYGVLPLVPHALIDTHGKTDPRGLDLARVFRAAMAWVDAEDRSAPDPSTGDTITLPPLPAPDYTDRSPLLALPTGTDEQYVAAWLQRASYVNYDEYSIRVIAGAYWTQCALLGLDPWLVAAQCMHETGNLASWWSARPRRNPAGIGVNGEIQPPSYTPITPDWHLDEAANIWRRGLAFDGWLSDSIPAHVGRLLAYALPIGEGTTEQRAAIVRALSYRGLPDAMRGSAPTLKPLGRVHNPSGQGWASPGSDYGEKIAAIANLIAS